MNKDDAITKILEIRELVKKHRHDPVSLSEDAVALATYNAYLGDVLADLHHKARQTELTAFKNARNQEETVADSERIAKEKSLEPSGEYETVKYIYQSTGNLVTAIQSHTKTLLVERNQNE